MEQHQAAAIARINQALLDALTQAQANLAANRLDRELFRNTTITH